jgi:hypothetical protein
MKRIGQIIKQEKEGFLRKQKFDVKIKLRKYKFIEYQVSRIFITSEKTSSYFFFLICSSIFWQRLLPLYNS